MAGCQAGRELSPTCLLRSLAQSLETHTEEGMAIKPQGDRKGRVLAGRPVVGKLSPSVRASLFLSFVVKKSPATHIFADVNHSGGEMERVFRLALVGRKRPWCGERGTNL